MQHPIVNQSLDLIIAQREPTQFGVPVEVYFFLSDKVWREFERIQSDIFDHLLKTGAVEIGAGISIINIKINNIRKADK